VVDFALNLRGVDPDRMALIGMSMGGYLAPRAAAFEHRLAACIAYDGVMNMTAVFNQAATPPGSPLPEFDSDQTIAGLDGLIAHRTELPSSPRWAVSNALWVFNSTTAKDFVHEVSGYDLTGIAEQITCPTLVCEAEHDQFFSGQPQMLFDALRCPKTLMKFTAAEGAEEHCHVGALTLFHQRMFDWLDETLAS
jgi:pimeloyl-ACP methyl ester carboxylesterase